ncbi:PKD domain-containing protein [Thalassotalea piscium]
MNIRNLSFLLIITTLTACGGGTSDDSPKNTGLTATNVSIIAIEDQVKIGQSADLVLYAPNEEISNIKWSQTAGEPITLLAKTSKVVSFSASNSGDYTFSVSFKDSSGTTQTLNQSITVTNEISPMSLRLSHAVIEQNAVSLRTYFDSNVDTSTIKWKQVSGPTVSFTDNDTKGKFAVFFDAPSVTKDTLLEFEVSLTHNQQTYSDKMAVLVENSDIPVLTSDNAYFQNDRVARVFPYNPDSPVADVLVDCVYSNKLKINDNACNFSTTPLIAHVTQHPSVNDIMDHVLVSHQWMGDRFKAFLETFDHEHNDFKNLLRATTAIVISYDIRPSFYQGYTGAIYLDPDDLWLTPEERDTINQAPDYRSTFGSDLQFEMPWRYVKDNNYASFFPDIRYRLSRNIDDTLYSFASLLYHELAHANDYFPSTLWNSVNRSTKIELIAYNRIVQSALQSDSLQIALPLNGNEMWQLGKVRFHNDPPANNTQKAYTTDDVAHFFKSETAPQFYSYSSTREDFAVLFDGFMMKNRYDVQRDVMVTDQNLENIAWGQRGREGESAIMPRIEFVTERVLPEFEDVLSALSKLPAPTPIPVGGNFWDSLVLNAPAKNTIANQLLQQSKQVDARYHPVIGRSFDNKHLPTINLDNTPD